MRISATIARAGMRRGARGFSAVPKTMRAAVVRQVGGPDVLKVEKDYPVPAIADGQVRARAARA